MTKEINDKYGGKVSEILAGYGLIYLSTLKSPKQGHSPADYFWASKPLRKHSNLAISPLPLNAQQALDWAVTF